MDETTYNLIYRLHQCCLQYELPEQVSNLLDEAALRIETLESYLEGAEPNVEVISWLANTMKNNATPEQLLQFAKTVMERHASPGG
jgi:hypothetical protein